MYRYPFRVQIERGHQVDPERRRVLTVYESFDFDLRSLSRAEYTQLQSEYPDPVDFQNAVLEAGTVRTPASFQGEPFTWDRFYAGLASQVYEKILTLSGFVRPDGAIDPALIGPARAYLESEDARYDLLIMTAFDHYRLEDLLRMDPQNWHRLIGMAEAKLRVIGIDPNVILNPGLVQRQQALEASEAEAANQLQMLMRRRDGSLPKIQTQQMVFTADR